MIPQDHAVGVVLPTRNEADNIVEVLARIEALGCCAQVVVVDDGDDDTASLARATGNGLDLDVHVIERRGRERQGGLSTAVVAGIERLDTPVVVVMDADLQHPPELIPTLVAATEGSEMAIASRLNLRSVAASLPPHRRAASWIGGAAARIMFRSLLAGVVDPMSGYFAVRASSLHTDRLHPNGYKILLEVLLTHPELSVTQIPFSFGRRLSGESKAGLVEGVRYFSHLVDLKRRSQQISHADRPERRQLATMEPAR